MRVHYLLKILAYLGLCGAAFFIAGWTLPLFGLRDPVLPGLIGVTAATWAAVRLLDRRKLADLGLKWEPRTSLDLGVGLFLPLPLLGAVFAAEWAAGWLLVTGVREPTLPFAAQALWRFGAIAWYEELFARGYLLRILARHNRPWEANLFSALVFAGLHLANPGFSPQSFIGILLAGIFLGLCYQITRSLYLPMAFHLSWNMTQAMLGFPVSGTSQAGLVRLVREGPAFYTGGAFGPEAGVLGFAAILVAIGIVRQYGLGRSGLRQRA